MNSTEIANVSVVIPCYCCVETIERALRSVMQQSMLPIEIILVEDASPDRGATLSCLKQLCHSFGNDIPIRLIILDENTGPAGARNAAWEVAIADFLAFLDADDAWHPQKIEIQYHWMKLHQNVALSGHHSCQVESLLSLPLMDVSCQAWSCNFYSMLFKNPFATRTVMIRRDVSVRFVRDKRYAEDYLLWLQVVATGFQVYLLDSLLAYSFKPAFGRSGLSADLWAMEKGVQDSFRRLHCDQMLSGRMRIAASVFEYIKFCRRMVICVGRYLVGLKMR